MDIKQLQLIKNRFGITGIDPKLNRAIEVAMQVAPTDLSVLIEGESGVGKESFPKIIHAYSSRKNKKYFAINCGAIPEGTIDSELFGHEKGSFTGAVSDRKGYFEEADGGTIFLDEVGELPLPTQTRLLRVLEAGEFLRVGSSQVRKTNVRVVAATNVNMQAAIREGSFREDLYYRLAAVAIQVPALRKRIKPDISLLFRTFARAFAEQNKIPPITLTPEATTLVENYYWQGNIRQLKNIVEQISVLEHNREITPEVLQQYLPESGNTVLPVLSAQANANRFANPNKDLNITLLLGLIQQMQNEIADLKQAMAHIGAATEAIPADNIIPANLVLPASKPTAEPAEPQTTDYPPQTETESEQPSDDPKTIVVKASGTTMDDIERQAILLAIEQNGGNQSKAAEQLGLSRRTIARKIKDIETK